MKKNIKLTLTIFICFFIIIRLYYSFDKVYNFCSLDNIDNECILNSSPKGFLRIDGEYVISGGDVVIDKKIYINNIRDELEKKSKLTFIEKIFNKEYLYKIIGIE